MTHCLFRRRTFFLSLAAVVMMVVGRPTAAGYVSGLVLAVFGQAVRFWAAGYIVKTEELTVTGPFAWVRNPLYVGSLLIACGYCAMAGGWIVWAVVIPLFFAVHGSAVIWEERFLRSKFGEAFEDYCRRVPRWMPRPPRRGIPGGRISVEQLKANREHVRSLGTLAVVVVFLLKLVF